MTLRLIGLGLAAVITMAAAAPVHAVDAPKKVFRYAFRIAEAGFDPARVSDLYSRTIIPHINEALYEYDPLARPSRLRPRTAAAMPEVSADFRTWTIRIKPGIYFASDAAFKDKDGKPVKRELVAEDYVYSFKRFADPKVNSPSWSEVEGFQILGLAEVRQKVIDSKQPFPYDAPVEGLRALDRYTLQIRLRDSKPRFAYTGLAQDLYVAVAREVVEFYGENITGHPVGTGPFKLVQWRRSSLIALERNPDYREVLYDAQPAADDAEGQAILKSLKGRRLPMLDRVEVSIIDEAQPRWLTFLKKDSDFLEEVPVEFITQAMPGGKVAPNLARQGMQGFRMVRSDAAYTYFNMDDPIVGGYTPQKIALRRAIGLAIDVEREIRLVRRSQAIVAQSSVLPHTTDYDPNFRSENGEYSVAKAKALLDMYGYVDKDGDGWRDMPDGSPLVLNKSTLPDQTNRQLDEQWQRNMKAIGVQIRFLPAKFQENLKAARGGKLQMWGLGGLSSEPDSLDGVSKYSSHQIDGLNYARFRLPAADAIYAKLNVLPDGPERHALFVELNRLSVAYMPYKTHVHRYINDMAQAWVVGYRRPVFWTDFWQYLDIDTSKLPVR